MVMPRETRAGSRKFEYLRGRGHEKGLSEKMVIQHWTTKVPLTYGTMSFEMVMPRKRELAI